MTVGNLFYGSKAMWVSAHVLVPIGQGWTLDLGWSMPDASSCYIMHYELYMRLVRQVWH